MNSKVTPEGLGSAINEILETYTEALTEDCNKSAADLAKYGSEELKDKAAAAGIKGKKYRNSLRNTSPSVMCPSKRRISSTKSTMQPSTVFTRI